MSSDGTTRRQDRTAALAGPVSVALAVAAVVLFGFIVHARSDGNVGTLDAGQSRSLVSAPYATDHTVKLPGVDVSVRVAEPLDSIEGALIRDRDHPDVDSWAAPDGGRLVPVSWRAQSTSSDPATIDLHLVTGDDRKRLGTGRLDGRTPATQLTSVVVAVAGELDLDDVAVEVEYDGLTQVLHPASGEVDAGVAQALYEPPPELEAACAGSERGCPVAAADKSSDLQIEGTVESRVTFQAYDSQLGWAEEGSLWAQVEVRGDTDDHVEDAAGNPYVIWESPPITVTLDGERPARRTGFEGVDRYDLGGVAVFRVADDAMPEVLRLRYTLNLSGEPGELSVAARVPLEPVE